MPEANVGLFDIATVAEAADAVELETTILVIRLTVLAAGVRPVNAVVPLYVHDVFAVLLLGVTYAVFPYMLAKFAMLGFAIFYSLKSEDH